VLDNLDALLTHRITSSTLLTKRSIPPRYEVAVEIEAHEEEWRSGHENYAPACQVIMA
jgi:hypothetical protein